MPVKGHGDWTPVNAKPISGTTFTVPNLIEGSEFEFRVVAINDAGPGKPSKSTGPHKVRDPICKLTVTSRFTSSLPSAGPGADPGVQAVSTHVTFQVVLRLPLLSTRSAVTFLAEERHRPSTSTKLYCLVTEVHRCEQLAQCCYAALSQWELNPRSIDHKSNALSLRHYTTVLIVHSALSRANCSQSSRVAMLNQDTTFSSI